jgi:2-dehydropantoate 2-reductase
VARYIIIGAGAVGGTIGARLFESGHEVVLAARGAHYQALREHGLRFVSPDGDRVLPIPAVDHPDALTARPDDILVLATKTQDTAAALDVWSAHTAACAEPLPIVLAQNGVENERLALRRSARTYGMCVWLPATHLEPGVVEAWSSPYTGVLHLGCYPNGEDGFIHRVSEDLEQSGFRAPVHADVMRWKYSKLLGNLANGIEALCGPLDDAGAEALYQRIRAEGTAVLDAAGIAYASPEEEAPFRELLKLQPIAGRSRAGGSTWQSLARGAGSVETDYLNGEIVLLARLHGLSAPVNETVRRLVADQAREQRAPGSLTTAELAARVDAASRTTLSTRALTTATPDQG